MSFKNLKNYFEDFYKGSKNENAVSFLDNDFADLENNGSRGYGVWISWPQSMENEPRLIKLLKVDNFIRKTFLNDFQDYIAENGGNPTEFEIDTRTNDYDAFRVYHICTRYNESKKLVDKFLKQYLY